MPGNASLTGLRFAGPFFIFMGIGCFPWILAAECDPFISDASVEVSYTYDGDTIKLKDGNKLRLIGINTPEIGHEAQPDEPGAQYARQRLQTIISASNNQIFLLIGNDRRDRYQRILAHIYNLQGANITETLLREGLGYAVYMSPNLTNMECYSQAERQARTAGRGIWKHPDAVLDVNSMHGREEGFHLIRGVIGRIGKSRRSLWLNLHQGPAIRIDWSDWKQFDGWQLDTLEERPLEVRGWIYRRNGQQRLQVRHPAAIMWLDTVNSSALR